MNKASLIKDVAIHAGYQEADVRVILDSTGTVIQRALAAKDEAYLLGLGKLCTVKRPPKKARDIRRGTDVLVPARTAVVFRASKPLTTAVNKKRAAK